MWNANKCFFKYREIDERDRAYLKKIGYWERPLNSSFVNEDDKKLLSYTGNEDNYVKLISAIESSTQIIFVT